MRKLLIGLLALGSVSSFATEISVDQAREIIGKRFVICKSTGSGSTITSKNHKAVVDLQEAKITLKGRGVRGSYDLEIIDSTKLGDNELYIRFGGMSLNGKNEMITVGSSNLNISRRTLLGSEGGIIISKVSTNMQLTTSSPAKCNIKN